MMVGQNFFVRFLEARDDLSLRGFRPARLCALLLFPLTIIAGDTRSIDIGFSYLEYSTSSFIFIFYGLGYLVFLFLPPRSIPGVFKCAAILGAALLAMQFIFPPADAGVLGLTSFFVFHFANGICSAVGLFSYMFALRNIERLIGIIILELWFVVIDDLMWELPGLQEFMAGCGAVIFAGLVVVLAFRSGSEDIPIGRLRQSDYTINKQVNPGSAASKGYFIFFCDICYFTIGTLHYYLEYTYTYEFNFMFGLASLIGVALLLILILGFKRSAIQLWNIFFVFALIAFTCQFVNTQVSVNIGAFFYGFGDAIGYIMVQYMVGCVGRRHMSYGFFRVACGVAFVEYVLCTIILDTSFMSASAPDQAIAFIIVVSVVCIGLMMTPALVKRFFDTNWSDEFQAADMTHYREYVDRAEQIAKGINLELTPREKEIFALLLTELQPKQISEKLKISTATVNFHTTNIYRKLSIQSRTELFAKYSV